MALNIDYLICRFITPYPKYLCSSPILTYFCLKKEELGPFCTRRGLKGLPPEEAHMLSTLESERWRMKLAEELYK